MSAYVPPGWPSGVHPPGTEDFERTAQAWLLDTVPADYRLHGVLRRYPHALDAVLAAYRAEGRRLVATAQAVELVARALRGEVFTPQLQDAPGTPDELSARRTASDSAEGAAAERPARDGAAKARKAPAAQRPARNGGTARRKTKSGEKQAAAG